MSQQPPWDAYGQQDPGQYQGQPYQGQYQGQPYRPPPGKQPYPPQGPPPPYQGLYPPQSPPPQSRKPPRRRRTRGRRIFNIVCLLIIVIAVISVIATVMSGSSGAKYSAHVVGSTVINPADLAVVVRVSNTGTKPGTPTCTIKAEDPSYTYTGIDIAPLHGTVGVGASATFVDNLTIKKQGAGYVTQVTVSC
jgi:hypothetical protein